MLQWWLTGGPIKISRNIHHLLTYWFRFPCMWSDVFFCEFPDLVFGKKSLSFGVFFQGSCFLPCFFLEDLPFFKAKKMPGRSRTT